MNAYISYRFNPLGGGRASVGPGSGGPEGREDAREDVHSLDHPLSGLAGAEGGATFGSCAGGFYGGGGGGGSICRYGGHGAVVVEGGESKWAVQEMSHPAKVEAARRGFR